MALQPARPRREAQPRQLYNAGESDQEKEEDGSQVKKEKKRAPGRPKKLTEGKEDEEEDDDEKDHKKLRLSYAKSRVLMERTARFEKSKIP